ncbi:ATP-dependent RNA helicase eIF4A [Schistosoma japonicum]|uniref:RNA helicase n=1 Tax=Schistosoma japonicum TaxID=6182 RepID=Q5DCD8_SCHJA|nr:SJCHGC06278 protein [Schistosoma japonicum]KAH8855229.1 ATP-dependent RNA helicase eIF4A [Schistosoma japonicum]TNN15675.1 ATP-dependent RNA helicase eIF4A [Schistosoma japonicum]CAX70997.1 Eukaryotic initiation factor 4A [Schistosoma japonicum]CAX76292.1 Eukaryotic initiation factor 4A [Schistosoma japonicum]
MSNSTEDSEIETNYYEVVDGFEKLGLKSELLRGIYSYGYEKPSAIQQRAIKPSVEGRDVIAQAQSGTGKTATFAISILQRIDVSSNTCQALVLVPTRELARQIQTVVQRIGSYLNVRCHTCIGGTRMSEDVACLQQGQHVVVGTPGRVIDMMNRSILATSNIKIFVLDEADQMLGRGFEPQIKEIYKYLPESAQIMLLSATMPKQMLTIARGIMQDPVQILIKKEELTLDGIKQFYINVSKEEYKLETLMDLYKVMNLSQVVIFVNSVRKASYLSEELANRNFQVSCINSDMEQEKRDRVMEEYRSGRSRILLSTDVLARGIDVQQVSLVVNYDLPGDRETYIHRIGRGGRFGRKGTAINFITDTEKEALRDLQTYYNTEILEMPDDIVDFL